MFENILLGIAEAMSNISGKKLIVELDEHKINLEWVKPEKYRNSRGYYEDAYVNGMVKLDGYVNSIKPTVDKLIEEADDMDEEEVKKKLNLKVSDNYKTYMKQNLIAEVSQTDWSSGGLKLKEFIMYVLGAVGIGFIVMLMMAVI